MIHFPAFFRGTGQLQGLAVARHAHSHAIELDGHSDGAQVRGFQVRGFQPVAPPPPLCVRPLVAAAGREDTTAPACSCRMCPRPESTKKKTQKKQEGIAVCR